MSAGRSIPVRGPVAVLLSRFPLVTETFILREVDELERQGQPVRLVPLLREEPEVVHAEARPWMERALFTPYLSPAIVAANLRRLRHRPLRYLATLLRLAAGNLRSPGFLVRGLALFPKAVYLAERLEGEGVRHLHAHYATHPATVAWIAARLGPLTYSLTVHAHDLFVDRTFLAAKLAAAARVRCISRFNRDLLAALHPRYAGKLEVVHVGVETRRYEVAAGARRGEPPLLLCVAGLKPYKGIPVLLAACEELARRGRDFRCAVVGDGPLRREIAAEIARRGLGGRVEMLGARPQDEVAALLGRASVVVCPSVVAPDGQMEGIPVVLMEAGAAGRPVAAAALSGIPELVADGAGELFEPGDAAALADALERLLADPERAAGLGRALRRRVREDFSLEGTTAGLLALLDREARPAAGETERRFAATAAGLDGVEALGVRRVVRGIDAEVAELLVRRDGSSGGCLRMIGKRHLARPGESAPPEERTRREAEVLRRLAALATPRFAAPRVLAADPERAVVLLSPAAGEPLDRLLRGLRGGRGAGAAVRLGRLGRLAGGWLAWLQASWPERWPDLDPRPAVVERGRRAVARAAARGALSPRQAAAADRRLAELAAAATPAAVPRHGDFWPGNVLVAGGLGEAGRDGGGRVEVLDFEAFGPGLPEEDPAALLVHAALYFPPPLGRRRRAFEAGVLAGWGGAAAGLALCRAEVAARLLAADGAGEGSPALRAWRRRRLRRELLGSAVDGRLQASVEEAA